MGENVFDKDVSYLREVYDKQLRIEDLNTQLHRERNEEKKQKKALSIIYEDMGSDVAIKWSTYPYAQYWIFGTKSF